MTHLEIQKTKRETRISAPSQATLRELPVADESNSAISQRAAALDQLSAVAHFLRLIGNAEQFRISIVATGIGYIETKEKDLQVESLTIRLHGSSNYDYGNADANAYAMNRSAIVQKIETLSSHQTFYEDNRVRAKQAARTLRLIQKGHLGVTKLIRAKLDDYGKGTDVISITLSNYFEAHSQRLGIRTLALVSGVLGGWHPGEDGTAPAYPSEYQLKKGIGIFMQFVGANESGEITPEGMVRGISLVAAIANGDIPFSTNRETQEEFARLAFGEAPELHTIISDGKGGDTNPRSELEGSWIALNALIHTMTEGESNTRYGWNIGAAGLSGDIQIIQENEASTSLRVSTQNEGINFRITPYNIEGRHNFNHAILIRETGEQEQFTVRDGQFIPNNGSSGFYLGAGDRLVLSNRQLELHGGAHYVDPSYFASRLQASTLESATQVVVINCPDNQALDVPLALRRKVSI